MMCIARICRTKSRRQSIDKKQLMIKIQRFSFGNVCRNAGNCNVNFAGQKQKSCIMRKPKSRHAEYFQIKIESMWGYDPHIHHASIQLMSLIPSMRDGYGRISMPIAHCQHADHNHASTIQQECHQLQQAEQNMRKYRSNSQNIA